MQWLGDLLTSIGGFLLLGELWVVIGRRNLEALYLFTTGPTIAAGAFLLFAEVDLFASFWGPHVWWKLIPAALVFALFWPVALAVFHSIRSRWKRRIGFAWAACTFCSLLVWVLVDWALFPAVKSGSEEALQLFPWLSIHPSLAIHHLYANATLLGLWELLGASLLVGKPLASKLAYILGSQRNSVLLNAIVFIGSLILRIVAS